MLDQYVVDRIVELLADNRWSRRQIARQLGVSRSSVDDIANGRRGRHGRSDDPPCESEPPVVGRCGGCGVRVYLPCVACRARQYRYRLQSRRATQSGGTAAALRIEAAAKVAGARVA